VGLLGFVAMLVLAIGNISISNTTNASNPKNVFTHHVLNHISVTLRSAILLWIFSVRMPRKDKNTSKSVNIFNIRKNNSASIMTWPFSFSKSIRDYLRSHYSSSKIHMTSNASTSSNGASTQNSMSSAHGQVKPETIMHIGVYNHNVKYIL
jgi:hypothetical protein